jgi:DNA topoisomerase I
VLDFTTNLEAMVDPREAADIAGLRYVSDEKPGIRRRRAGKGFVYIDPDGARISDPQTLRRLKSLAVPPAWTQVWICSSADGHIQATGRDAKRRKQYRYHPAFREVRESVKFEHMLEFAEVLPVVRAKVREHMAQRGLGREKVLATVVHLLETTLIRVGNEDYARQNDSYGLTTLESRHVEVEGSAVRFQFTGKSGKQWSLQLRDRRVAKIIRACQELPGQDLLRYFDVDGKLHSVGSDDVNGYLRQISGRDVTAKDFRTWAGTLMAAMALNEVALFESAAQAKRNLRAAIARVSACLGNTPTICRKCYVHPEVVNGYLEKRLVLQIELTGEADAIDNLAARLRPEETALLVLLRSRPNAGALASDAARDGGDCEEPIGAAAVSKLSRELMRSNRGRRGDEHAIG